MTVDFVTGEAVGAGNKAVWAAETLPSATKPAEPRALNKKSWQVTGITLRDQDQTFVLEPEQAALKAFMGYWANEFSQHPADYVEFLPLLDDLFTVNVGADSYTIHLNNNLNHEAYFEKHADLIEKLRQKIKADWAKQMGTPFPIEAQQWQYLTSAAFINDNFFSVGTFELTLDKEKMRPMQLVYDVNVQNTFSVWNPFNGAMGQYAPGPYTDVMHFDRYQAELPSELPQVPELEASVNQAEQTSNEAASEQSSQ